MSVRQTAIVLTAVFLVCIDCSGPPVEEPAPQRVEPVTRDDIRPDEGELRIRRDLALALVDENQYARAWQHLEIVFAAGLDSWWLHLAAAQCCLYWSIDYACVRGHSARALELRPNNARAHLYLAQVAQDEGDFETAISHYREGLDRRPREIDMSLQLASLYLSLDQRGPAIAVLQDALRLSPGNARIMLRIARIAEDDDPTLAESLYTTVISRHEDPIMAANHLIRFYLRQGRDRDAEEIREWVQEQVGTRQLRPLR